MSAWFSLPQQWLMTTWNKQTCTILAQKSVAVLPFEGQMPRALKRFVCKLLRFLLRRFCRQNWYYAQLYTSSISTMRQEARKGKSWGGTSMRTSKRTLRVFTACKQMKNRRTKCAFILVVVRPTVVWSSFHTEFLSSIRFSPLRLHRRRKRTRNFPAFSSGHLRRAKAKLVNNKS